MTFIWVETSNIIKNRLVLRLRRSGCWERCKFKTHFVKHIREKFCASVLFNNVTFIATIVLTEYQLWLKIKQLYVKHVNNCSPFNIKIAVKYNSSAYNSSAGCKLSGQNSVISEAFFALVNPHKDALFIIINGEIESLSRMKRINKTIANKWNNLYK